MRPFRSMLSSGRNLAIRLGTAAICLLAPLPVAGCSGDATLPRTDVAGLWVQYDQNGMTPLGVWLHPHGDSVPGAASWLQGGVTTEYQVVGRLEGNALSLDFYWAQSKEFTYTATVNGTRMEGTLRFTDPASPPRAGFVLQKVEGGAKGSRR
jgi:hypothetical protein